MTVLSLLIRIAAPLAMAGLVVACGAKTLVGNAAPGGDSGVNAEAGSPDDGSTCVDIEVAPSDVACASDSDCALTLSGRVCDGRCSCGNTPVNAAAAARFESDTASLTLEACPCAFPGVARCLGGQCTLCGLGPNAPAGCSDAATTTSDGAGPPIADGGGADTGVSTSDGAGREGDTGISTSDGAGREVDTGISTSDGGTCVDLVVTPSDVSCARDSDCTLRNTGEVCSGQCLCGNNPVNTTASARFQTQIASLTFQQCPCAAFAGEARCLGGQCARCAGFGPGDPAGCNDAGTGTTDAGRDSGVSTGDAGTCVDILLSAYDQSCNSASDCIVIQTGEVCSGQCACGNESVNATQQSRYQQAIRGIATGQCSCPLQLAPTCLGNKCTLPVP
jgi:hypothetical protein